MIVSTSDNDYHDHDGHDNDDDNDCDVDDMEDDCNAQGELANGLDWSDDGIHLAGSTSDLEIFLWETNLCRPVNISTNSTLKFSSSSSATLSWRTLGAWASPIPPTACAASQVTHVPIFSRHRRQVKQINN